MNKTPVKSLTMTRLLPIAASMMICAGCAHYKVISSDKTVHRMKAAELFRAPVDGWFVPDARWLEIRDAMADRLRELESPISKPQSKE
jgi:hypothetical protein